MTKPHKILKVKDPTDSYTVENGTLFDLPSRMLLVAKSGMGKNNLVSNLFLSDKFPYHKQFKGDNIHIFAPAIKSDYKMDLFVNQFEIPEENLHEDYSDDLLLEVYDGMVEQFKENLVDEEKPEHKLLMLDDLSFSGAFSTNRFNALTKVFCNGRKWLVSCCVLSQFYTAITPQIRQNANAIFIFNTPLSQLDKIEAEHNFLKDKKTFIKMFQDNVKGKHDFLAINYTNDFKDLYMNTEFESIMKQKEEIKNIEE